MKAVIQRVSKASVLCSSGYFGEIELGLLVLLGIEEADNVDDINWLASKIIGLRIFPDDKGVMNKNICEVEGELLIISQFTLHASTRKGNRPSYIKAAKPEISQPLYEKFVQTIELESDLKVKKGVFGDHMDVSLVNDGPVTIIIDTKNKE
ncbi:MAG: D-tyrosyl-tRNA(Tyr) deacylase [Bacteroidales bacterium]|nr:D-tyrosyl-tRNA(Tyr) deacylase [Bacteroidales bacterium]MCF8391453.1 D-tyrosyl-tRNA(Tyr) deacylase [Bacteroidales bacterium]